MAILGQLQQEMQLKRFKNFMVFSKQALPVVSLLAKLIRWVSTRIMNRPNLI